MALEQDISHRDAVRTACGATSERPLLPVTLAGSFGLALTMAPAPRTSDRGEIGPEDGLLRVPYILEGPWYLTWLTSFVTLAFCVVHLRDVVQPRLPRWNVPGLVASL